MLTHTSSGSIPSSPEPHLQFSSRRKPYGSLGARVGGYVIDSIAMYFVSLGGAFLGGVVAAVMMGSDAPQRAAENAAAGGMLLGWIFWSSVGWFLNYGVLQGMTGATVGKTAFSLRVVDHQSGAPVGIGRSVTRTLCQLVSAIPLGAGYLATIWNPESRCWHDSICSTVVIRKNAKYPHQQLQAVSLSTEVPDQDQDSGFSNAA